MNAAELVKRTLYDSAVVKWITNRYRLRLNDFGGVGKWKTDVYSGEDLSNT